MILLCVVIFNSPPAAVARSCRGSYFLPYLAREVMSCVAHFIPVPCLFFTKLPNRVYCTGPDREREPLPHRKNPRVRCGARSSLQRHSPFPSLGPASGYARYREGRDDALASSSYRARTGEFPFTDYRDFSVLGLGVASTDLWRCSGIHVRVRGYG